MIAQGYVDTARFVHSRHAWMHTSCSLFASKSTNKSGALHEAHPTC